MEHGVFRAWLAEVDDLTVDQRRELEEVLAGRPSRAAVTAVIETSPGDERRCPHCGHGASVGCGQADGLRRFRCKGCGRSFNALTGTPLARLRKKECWLDFGRSLSEGETVVASAERCGGQHRLSLAPPLSHRPGGQPDLDRHRRGRRNLRAAQL
jgi:transposase-like protein